MTLSQINPIYILVTIAIATIIFAAGKWIGHVNADREVLKQFIEEARNDIKEILARLDPKVTTTLSPTRLTELGKLVSECVDAKGITEQLAKKMQEKVRGKANFQIQTYCEKYIRDEFEPSDETALLFEKCAYENCTKMHHINLVLTIELRDKLLELQGLEL